MTDAGKVTWLTSFSHFITHGYMSLLPALLVVISGEYSMNFLDIGIIANVGYFLYGLGAFPAGWLADRYGSKRMLTIGVLGMSIASLLVGVVPGAVGFAVTYALLGIFASIHHPAGLSFIARRVTEGKGRALGLHGVLGNVGLFLTPLVAAGCVLLFGSWRSAYILYGLVGLVFCGVLQRTTIHQEKDLSLRKVLARGGRQQRAGAQPAAANATVGPVTTGTEMVLPIALLLLFVGSVLSGFIFRGSLTFFPTLLQREVTFIANHDEPVVIAGFVTTAILSLGLIGAWFGGWFNDRLRVPELFPAVIFVIVAPVLYLISRYTDWQLLAVSSLFSLVYYAWQPAQNYLIARYTRHSSHGKGFGVNFFLIFGVGSIATASGGYVSDTYGVDYFYAIMAVVAVCAMIVALTVLAGRSYALRCSWRLEHRKTDLS